MKEYPIYCAGNFITSNQSIEVVNPYTGKAFAKTYLASEEVLEEAINTAQKVEEKLGNLPSFKRYEILMKIARELESRKDEFAENLCMESAKPMRYAIGEVNRAIQTFTIAAEESKRLPREYISLDWTTAGEGKEGIVKHFPIGIVAGISPFNFPLNLAVHKIAPAIASGCPIILKPATKTPLSTLKLAQIIDQTELPSGAVSILPMDRKTGNQLVTDARFKLLSFTGSAEVGWKMKENAGKKKVVLELGGNAGVIVSDSCDLDKAVDRCVFGGYAYSGQVCIHAQRIYVADEVYDKFVEQYVHRVENLQKGDPLESSTEISAMIDEDNAKRVISWIGEALEGGARLLSGGKLDGTYVSPTVLTQTQRSMKVVSEEVFGPVVTIEKYKNFNDAITRMNDTEFGLQAGAFTNRINEMKQAFEQLRVGGVIINDVPTFRVDHMPYGGIKDSGLGREGVKYAIADMMETRILVTSV